MNFQGFTQEDFDVFNIEGLDQRMEGIITHIRPKFEALSTHFTPYLESLSGNEMFPHIAKHARRTVNPPKDTWIAFSSNKRGYKMAPHFQIGLFDSHLFVWFAIIYEAPIKTVYAEKLLDNVEQIKQQIPSNFFWSWNHMSPEAYSHGSLDQGDLVKAFTRLKEVKKAEVLCGLNIERTDPVLENGAELISKMEEAFHTTMPLYKLSF